MNPTPVPSPEEVKNAYDRHGDLRRAGAELGIHYDKVRSILTKSGFRCSKSHWTQGDLETLRKYYLESPESRMSVCAFARSMGRTEDGIFIKAGRMGYSLEKHRKYGKKEKQLELPWGMWVKHPHPRGMAGKAHSDIVKKRISKTSHDYWEKCKSTGTGHMSEENRNKRSDKMLKQNFSDARLKPAYSRCKRGKRDDIGGHFFRSSWEANFARYLNWLIAAGKCHKWEYEVDTFWFEKIRRGVRSYTPDFKVWDSPDSEFYYIEVKGWMDPKSKTKLNRMRIYHPKVRVDLVDEKRYRGIARTVGGLIANWEGAK